MIPSLVLWCAMSPWGLRLLHRGAFFAAHGPSSLCVDFVNYLGCQDPTTAYPRRGSWGGDGARGKKKKRECVREAEKSLWRAGVQKSDTESSRHESKCAFREQTTWVKDNIVTHCRFLHRKRSTIHTAVQSRDCSPTYSINQIQDFFYFAAKNRKTILSNSRTFWEEQKKLFLNQGLNNTINNT